MNFRFLCRAVCSGLLAASLGVILARSDHGSAVVGGAVRAFDVVPPVAEIAVARGALEATAQDAGTLYATLAALPDGLQTVAHALGNPP